MCRLMVYLGTPCLLADLVTKPSRSLTRQSFDAKERLTGYGYLNGDGFGIGWYNPTHTATTAGSSGAAAPANSDASKNAAVAAAAAAAGGAGDPTPCVFSSIQPAWNNRNLERLANKIISPLIFAHVRAAYPGIPVNDANCQPFTCGRYMWMHNGGVGGFHRVRRKLLDSLRDDVYEQCPSFESDSAICFALFLNRIRNPMVELSPDEIVTEIQGTIADIRKICDEAGVGEEESLLNFVVSDGCTVVATRYCNVPGSPGASLYYASGSRFECVDRAKNDYLVKHADRRNLLGIVASEPLTDESSDWIKVPMNTAVVMTRSKGVFVDLILVPIAAPPPVARDVARAFKSLASCTKRSLKVSLAGLPSTHHQPPSLPLNGRALQPNPSQARTRTVAFADAQPLFPPQTSLTAANGAADYDRQGLVGHGGDDGEEDNVDDDARANASLDSFMGIDSYPDAAAEWGRRRPIGTVRPPDSVPLVEAPRHSMSGGSCERQPVLALAVDGSRVFAGSQDGMVHEYDLVDFRCVRSVQAHSQTIFALTVHSDRLYTSSTRVVKIWDIATLQLLSHLRYSDGDVFALALALGRSVAGPAGTTIIRCNRGTQGTQSRAVAPALAAGEVKPPAATATAPTAQQQAPQKSCRESVSGGSCGSGPVAPAAATACGASTALAAATPCGAAVVAAAAVAAATVTGLNGASGTECAAAAGAAMGAAAAAAAAAEMGLDGAFPCRETEAALALTDTLKGGHCSRVFALVVCYPLLCSGAGDTFVKVWSLQTGECMSTLHGHKGGVLALAAVREQQPNGNHTWRLLSGSRDNTVRVWDLATRMCITTLTGHSDDVVALATAHPQCDGHQERVFSASADHTIRMWSLQTYECLRVFLQEGSTFLSIASTLNGVVTGSSDGVVRYWELEASPKRSFSSSPSFKLQTLSAEEEHTLMQATLKQLVGIRSVSTQHSTSSLEQAWKAASLIMGLLEDVGAEAKLVAAVEGTNPVVFGKIVQDPSRLTVTICGHYDVQAASSVVGWKTPPFQLAARDGSLYGRGVSSSKGPLVAMLFAVKELVLSGRLGVNVNFVIDGEQESGCRGFKEAVESNLEWFEGTGLILSASGAWISDEQPCLTYGMRGLICLNVEVKGPAKDLHSGTHGGTFNEPLNDLVTVLSNLVDSNNMILIPGFYDDVKVPDEEEERLYEKLRFNLEEYKSMSGLKSVTGSTAREVLQASWRNPSLSIVSVDSGHGTWSLIPKSCRARVVIRHVPNQHPGQVVERFRAHVAHEFAKLRSRGNTISVHVQHCGDWWLANPTCDFYKRAEETLQRHWHVKPSYIREGSTLHVIPFLEQTLGAPAIIIPISQATDFSALQNERLAWRNFVTGKDVLRDFLIALWDSNEDGDPNRLPDGM